MWRFRNFRRLGHEQFTAADATDEVRRHIRSTLLPKETDLGGHFVVEKTPANCIRTGFVEATVPEARFLFVSRDGSAIRKSILKKWLSGIDENAKRLNDDVPFRTLRAKLAKSRYIHRSEKLYYIGAELGQRWASLRKRQVNYWGPVVPEWKNLLGLPAVSVVNEACALMEDRFRFGISNCSLPYANLSYESLVSAPEATLRQALSEIDVFVPDLTPALRHFGR